MDDSFLAALFARRRRRVCGRWLRPYSYGHLVALAALGSPLLAGQGSGATINAGELLLAVRVLALRRPLDEAETVRVSAVDVWRRWKLERDPERLRDACQEVLDHISDHQSLPEFWQQEALDPELEEGTPSDSRTLSAPVALSRVASLIQRTTITEDRAWSMSIGLVHWYLGSLDELDGASLRFQREEDFSDEPPVEAQLSEREIFAQAVRHMGRGNALKWREQRRAAQRKTKRSARKKEGNTQA